jgi:uncharacterized protein (TIGR03437 family)
MPSFLSKTQFCFLLTSLAVFAQSALPPLGAIEKFAPVSGSSSAAYAIAASYPYKTVDGGATWIPLYIYGTPRDLLISAPIENYSPAIAIGVDPNEADRVLVGLPQQAGGIRRSVDGGVTWTEAVGIPRTPGNIVAFYFPRPGLMFAQGTAQVFKSTDGGATWSVAGPMQRTTGGLDINSTDPSKMWNWGGTGSASQSFHRSVDEGRTWSFISFNRGDNQPSTVAEMVSHPTRPNQVFALGVDGVYKSDNGGDLFARILPAQVSPGVNGRLFVDRSLANRLYFGASGQPGTAANATFCFAQQEASNIQCSAIENRSFIPLFVDAKVDNSILWAINSGGTPQRLCSSTTSARTWNCATPLVRPTLQRASLTQVVRQGGVRVDEARPIGLEPRTVRVTNGRVALDTRYEIPYTVAASNLPGWVGVPTGQSFVTSAQSAGLSSPGVPVTARGYLASGIYNAVVTLESPVANNGGTTLSLSLRVVPRDTDEMRYTYSVLAGPDPAIGPVRMAVDSQGLVYTGDPLRIRRRNNDGSWTVLAGTGAAGAATGDNGPATAAVLGGQTGMVVEGGGTIVYSNSSGLRRIGPDGLLRVLLPANANISTTGGATVPFRAPAGLAADRENRLYVGFNGGIARLNADRSAAERIYTSPATNSDVTNLAFDRQNRLWATLGTGVNATVIRFNAGFAGAPEELRSLIGFGPAEISFDSNNNALVPAGAELLQVSLSEETRRTIAGNGGFTFLPGTSYANFASLGGIGPVVAENSGNVLLAASQRILRLTPDQKPLPVLTKVGRPGELENPPRRLGQFAIEGSNFGERVEDVTVFFDAVAARIDTVSPTLITGQVPPGASGVPASVGVAVAGLPSVISEWAIAPSIVELVKNPGTNLVQAVFGDGTSHSTENPAVAGVEMTITALGVDSRTARTSVVVRIGEAVAEVIDAAPGPGTDGVFVVKLRVPETLTEAGEYPFVLVVDGTPSEAAMLVVKAAN